MLERAESRCYTFTEERALHTLLIYIRRKITATEKYFFHGTNLNEFFDGFVVHYSMHWTTRLLAIIQGRRKTRGGQVVTQEILKEKVLLLLLPKSRREGNRPLPVPTALKCLGSALHRLEAAEDKH